MTEVIRMFYEQCGMYVFIYGLGKTKEGKIQAVS